jgi:hypothetical protein
VLNAHLLYATTISGSVRDAAGAVYQAPAEVTLKSSTGFSKTYQLSREGRFRADVEPGTYSVTATVPDCYPYRRAPIAIKDGQDIELLIVPRMRILSVALHADGSDKAEIAPPPNYEEIQLGELPGLALLEFTGKKYVDKMGNMHFLDAVLTYSEWAIEADAIEIRKATRQIALSKWYRITRGETRIETGKARRIANSELTKVE